MLSPAYFKERAKLAWYYMVGVLGLRNGDVILTSFPRSGNTWLRFMFCNLLNIKEREAQEVTFPDLDQIMPELGASNLLRTWQFDVIPRVVKTHREYWPIFRSNESILLIRDPRDVMNSYYDYKRRDRIDKFGGSFSEFIRCRRLGIPAWAYHFKTWVDHADHIVSYEKMKDNDTQVFSNLINKMNVKVGKEVVKKAVQKSRFDKVQSAEESVQEENYFQFNNKTRFAREGNTNQWHDKFSERDISFYRNVLRKYDIYRLVPKEYIDSS